MNIQVNGESRDVAPGTTVSGLLDELGLSAKTTVVQRNDDILSQEEHGSTVLVDDDAVELVRFVGGG